MTQSFISPYPISVITASLPERVELLRECRDSVLRQRPEVHAHRVGVDTGGRGPAAVRNELVEKDDQPWVLLLDDDDLLDDDYTKVVGPSLLAAHARIAVVYTAWRVIGSPNPQPFLHFHPDLILAGHNHVPVTACVRREAFDDAGGFDSADELEDLGLWQRLLRLGWKFTYVPDVLWTYRRDVAASRNEASMDAIRLGRTRCHTCGQGGEGE